MRYEIVGIISNSSELSLHIVGGYKDKYEYLLT